MKISGAKTIAEFEEIRRQKIQNWIDQNFEPGWCPLDRRSSLAAGAGSGRAGR